MLSKPEGTLWVAASPLGNLQDVSPRLRHLLAQTSVIYAEDTRRSRILLSHLGLHTRLRSLHAHNERRRRHDIVGYLGAGDDVVLLTDAGTPAVSDPGAEVVDAAHAAGFRVSPLVGPSALTAALSVAGFVAPGATTLFLGFLPRTGKLRAEALKQLAAHAGLAVFFEAANRLVSTLTDMLACVPRRTICVCREMTKLHEEIRRDCAVKLLSWAQSQTLRGEMTLVVGPDHAAQPAQGADDQAVAAALKRCLAQGLSARDSALAVAAVLDVPRKRAYALCLQLVAD